MGLGVIAYSVTQGISNSNVFLDAHAAVIVIGGTMAVALIMFPFRHFLNLFRIYVRVLLGKARDEIFSTLAEITKVAKEQHNGQALSSLVQNVKNPFLKESLELVVQGGLTDRQLEEVLEKRVQNQNEKYKRDGATYKTLGKFPPAFGLVGATLGMIALLQGLGAPDAFEKLGPSMSIALVATFYGLVFANLIIIPVGENLMRASQDDLTMRRIVVDGVQLLKQKQHPIVVEEYLKSYLEPIERNHFKKVTGG